MGHCFLPSRTDTVPTTHTFLVLVTLFLAMFSTPSQGNARDMVTSNCNTPLTTGTRIMGTLAKPSTFSISLSRAGVELSPEPSSSTTFLYTPGEILKLSLPGINGEVAWETIGGAAFTTGAGCAGDKRAAARSPFLKLPSDALSTVQIWAGHAGGHTTVRITPTVTLKPNVPVSTPPSPQPSPTPTAPEIEGGSSSEGDDSLPASNPPTSPPLPAAVPSAAVPSPSSPPPSNPPSDIPPSPQPSPTPTAEIEGGSSSEGDDSLPAPNPPTSPPLPVAVPPAAVSPPSSPPPSNPPRGTKVYAADFTLILTTLPLQNFETSIARTLIADAAFVSPSRVYLEATAPSLFRRLWHFRLLQASSTELVVRITNLPDETTATALVSRLGPYFTSPQPTGFGLQYTKAIRPSFTASSLPVLMRESGTSFFTVGSLRSMCSLDSAHGLTLSWEVKDDMTAVELQLEGDGEGWIAGGFINEDTSMVTSPAHQVLLFDYAAGAAQALALQGYEASDLKEVNMSALGMTPLLLQSAAGKLYMRYEQSLAYASAPVDLTGTTNFMWAWAEFGYPAIHDRRGTVKVNWTAGTCKPSIERFLLEGYWLLLLPFIGLLLYWTGLKRTSWGHTLLQRRLGPIPTQLSVWVRTLTGGAIPTFLNLKYGEVWMMATYGILQLAFIMYWTIKAGAVGVRTTGIAFGKAALTNLMMTFLPVNKTTLWVRLFGISFERSVKFHRQLSYLAMATMTIHLLCMTLKGPAWDRTPLASGVVVAYGLLAFLSFTFMSLTAMLRRWCYELFRYAHYLYIAGTAFVLLHAPEAWQYLVIPCIIHVVDFLWRWYNILHNPAWATFAALPGNVTQVDVRNRQKRSSSYGGTGGTGGTGCGNSKWALPLEPGSYVWICIPRLSLLQWHPISISTADLLHEGRQSGAEAPLFHLHIKSLGKGTWTNGLYQIAAQEVENSQSHGLIVEDDNAPSAPPMSLSTLVVLVDGPYGKLSIDLQRYRQLVLVAGGIGLTPMTSVLSYISHCIRKGIMPRLKIVTLVWVLRDVALLEGFVAFLDQIRGELNDHLVEQQQPQQSSQQQCIHFGVEIYVTAVAGDTVDGANGIRLEDGSKAMHKQMGGGMRSVDGGGGGQKHFRILYGRPNMSEIFDTLVNDACEGQSAASTGVLACAPEGLLHQVQRQCVLRALDMHIEEFSY